MLIKITKCCDPMLWYNSHIGEEFATIRLSGEEYLVRASDGYLNIVKIGDCQIIESPLFNKENK